METTTNESRRLFQLAPIKKGHGITSSILSQGRFLVGRSESCEVVIPSNVVSSIHAVLEITASSVKVYDMNSKNSTFVNDKKIVAQTLSIGDTVSFGNITFIFQEYSPTPKIPPVLDILEPEKGNASIQNTTYSKLPVSPNLDRNIEESSEEAPYIVYPLSTDPKADYSEYIFEEAQDLQPIFKYDHGKQAYEVIILFNDNVYSVDYLPEKDGVYSIVGSNASKKQIEFPYFGKKEQLPFIEVRSGNCNVSKLHNYTCFHLSNDQIIEAKESAVNLQGTDIVKLVNGHIEIYVRMVSAPPKVKTAPFFKKDKNLRKALLLVLLFIFLPLVVLSRFEIDEELKKEKDPERIATILYKPELKVTKNKTVQKTEETEPKKQQAPKKTMPIKEVVKKEIETTPNPVEKVATKTVPKDPGSKEAPKKQIVKKVEKPAPKTPVKTASTETLKTTNTPTKSVKSASSSSSNSAKTAQQKRAVRPTNSQGHVDVYKSFNFKSTINNLVAKGGASEGANKVSGETASDIGGTNIGGGVATNLKKADVGTEVGSLTGSTVGTIGQSKGAEGLSAKKGIYTAGLPTETVVLGSIDPDIIRRILEEHKPQFSYCYQKALDDNPGKRVSDIIPLVFTIGASGHVTRAGVEGRSSLPASVKSCVVNVLRGIQFPSPLGGGTVDVKQAMNFQSKRI